MTAYVALVSPPPEHLGEKNKQKLLEEEKKNKNYYYEGPYRVNKTTYW